MSEELIGYRCWHIATRRTADPTLVEVAGQLAIPYSIVLQSLTRDDPWPGPVMHSDEVPRRGNSSGLYFLDTASAAQQYGRNAEVTGAALLYGKIVEHRGGYRAQHALLRNLTIHAYRIRDLVIENVAAQLVTLARVLERRYQCEVLIDSSGDERTKLQMLIEEAGKGNITPDVLLKLIELYEK